MSARPARPVRAMTPESVAVVDYGMGNLRSVSKAVEHVAAGRVAVRVTDDAREIENADRVVFPGQGAMRDCMAELAAHGLLDPMRECLGAKPVLGICMGLQVLFDSSEEDRDTPGFGWLAGPLGAFSVTGATDRQGRRLKVPHMGWNRVHQRLDHPLWLGIDDAERFLFRAQLPRVSGRRVGVVAGTQRVRVWSSPPPSPASSSSQCSFTPKRASVPVSRCSPTSWPGTGASERLRSAGFRTRRPGNSRAPWIAARRDGAPPGPGRFGSDRSGVNWVQNRIAGGQ